MTIRLTPIVVVPIVVWGRLTTRIAPSVRAKIPANPSHPLGVCVITVVVRASRTRDGAHSCTCTQRHGCGRESRREQQPCPSNASHDIVLVGARLVNEPVVANQRECWFRSVATARRADAIDDLTLRLQRR